MKKYITSFIAASTSIPENAIMKCLSDFVACTTCARFSCQSREDNMNFQNHFLLHCNRNIR